ncbi:MAG: LemA family protein [Candidatus Aenigmatarchaeota archaeon]
MIALIWLLPVGIVIIAFMVAYYYNRIVTLSNRIDEALAQIDVQLKKRADLLPNLVETVKGYAKHEKGIMDAAMKARENMLKAGTIQERIKAGTNLATALRSVFAIAENYPQLKASDNFKLLQEQLEGIENKIAYSRQFYNDAVLSFNNTVTTVPGSWFASMFGKNKTKVFLTIEEKERKPVKVDF